MTALHLTPPAPITSVHELADFDSGEFRLDDPKSRAAIHIRTIGLEFAPDALSMLTG